MNPETHTRAQARTEAAQKYHAMLAELYEMKPKPLQYAPVAGFPFRENLCREVALLACSQLEADDARLVFEFLGLTPFIHLDLSGTSLECNAADDCRALAHVPECSKWGGTEPDMPRIDPPNIDCTASPGCVADVHVMECPR